MYCIGIDPAYAKPIAFAYQIDRQWCVGAVQPDKPSEFAEIFATAKNEHGIDTAVIEDGFVGVNPKVALRLATMRGVLGALAYTAGLDVLMVAPATWQSAMLTMGHWTPKTHAEIIRQTIFRVRNLHGMNLTEDKAVAVLLAEWGDARRKREEN